MDIRDIRYFLELARQKNFTKTAAHFYITQSALSQKIHSLERELGVRLFDRSNRSVTLTPAGRLLHEQASGVMHAWEEMLGTMARFKADEQKNISIGLFMQSVYTELPAMITDFISSGGGYCVNISVTSEANLLSGVQNGTFDVAFLRCNSAALPEDVAFIPLYGDAVNVLLHRDDPLAAQTAVTLSDIVDYHLICEREEFNNSYDSLRGNFREEGLSLPAPYATTDQAAMLPMLISAPGFYAFTTAQSGRIIPARFSHLIARPLEPAVPITANLLYARERPVIAAHPFCRYVCERCAAYAGE